MNRLDASQDGEVAVKTTTPSTDIAEIRSNNNDGTFENLASVVTNMGPTIDYEASPRMHPNGRLNGSILKRSKQSKLCHWIDKQSSSQKNNDQGGHQEPRLTLDEMR